MKNNSTWIINRNADIKWFFLTSLASIIALFAYLELKNLQESNPTIAFATIYVVWIVFFDSPHIFATFARTYADRCFVHSHIGLVAMSLFTVIIPMGLMLVVFLLNGETEAHLFSMYLGIFAILFAYWHLCRQHWGILRAYVHKTQKVDPSEMHIDAALMAILLIAPFFYAFGRDLVSLFPENSFTSTNMASWRSLLLFMLQLGVVIQLAVVISKFFSLTHATLVLGITSTVLLSASLSGAAIFILGWGIIYRTFLPYVEILAVAAAFWLAYRSIHEYINDGYCSKRNLFMLNVIGLHTFVLLCPVHVNVAIVLLTFYHNLQYLRIVNHYCENRYSVNSSQQYGLAHRFSTIKGLTMGATLFSLLIFVPRAGYKLNLFLPSPFFYDLLQLVFWGIAFSHYYLDGVVWKLRDKDVQHDLLQLKS